MKMEPGMKFSARNAKGEAFRNDGDLVYVGAVKRGRKGPEISIDEKGIKTQEEKEI